MISDLTIQPPNSAQFRRVFLNGKEHAALDELIQGGYWRAYIMYVQCFRWRMDFNTGTVGVTAESQVSLDYLGQVLERQSKKGSKWQKKRPTRHEIRGAILALERVGLLARLPKHSPRAPMLFLLPLADKGSIRPQEEPHKEAHKKLKAVPPKQKGVRLAVTNEPHNEAHITEIYIQQQGIPLMAIVDLYHEVLPGCPKVKVWYTSKIQALVASVWQADERHRDLDFWRYLFERCRDSDFLRGRVFNERLGRFELNFYFICQNWAEILNGRYS